MDLLEVTTLLKNNGINSVASTLKVKKADIYTFLNSNGLKYVDGKVIPRVADNIKVSNKGSNINMMAPHSEQGDDIKYFDVNRLAELIDLIDPIKTVIEAYEKSINNSGVELKPPSVTEVKQKLFKIDVDILNKWDSFVSEHREFKVQSLISLAIDEFLKKYEK